jgi:D-sedoheptulose 7-phosphate isomerase
MSFANTLNEHIITSNNLIYIHDNINTASEIIANTFQNGNKVFTIGNGGSAADAQHLAAEFMVRYKKDRQPLPAISLSTDTSIITACANDYKYEDVFSRQLLALGHDNDCLIAFSTSGKSLNVLNAITTATSLNMNVILLSGQLDNDSYLKNNMNNINSFILLEVLSTNTARVQECHQIIYHYFCEYIDNVIMNEAYNYGNGG